MCVTGPPAPLIEVSHGGHFFMEVKKATSYKEQLQKIVARGCLVEDERKSLEILETVNYYRLTAYFLPFRKSDGTYLDGTTFSKVYEIYEFDRELRRILFSALEEIEVAMRARIAYYHARKFSPIGYLNASNYSHSHNHAKFLETFNREVEHSSSAPFVKHHIEKYEGKFPIWAAIELFSFGMVSYFYADLKLTDQKVIAKLYNTNPKNLKSWLRCATDLRNICAHYGRLYYRIFSAVPANITEIKKNEERSLWAVFLAIRNIYPNSEKWNQTILPLIAKLIEKCKLSIELKHISFPQKWEKIAGIVR